MINDPCEKERNEYEKALEEELDAKQMVDTSLKPIGVKTPPPSDLNALIHLKDKEEITRTKLRLLREYEEKHKK